MSPTNNNYIASNLEIWGATVQDLLSVFLDIFAVLREVSVLFPSVNSPKKCVRID
jgi:hypothetical protein